MEEPISELAIIADKLIELAYLEEEIGRSVDEKGMVLNSASRDLNRVRESLKGAHSRVVRKLEGHLAKLPERFVVPDGSVTIMTWGAPKTQTKTQQNKNINEIVF